MFAFFCEVFMVLGAVLNGRQKEEGLFPWCHVLCLKQCSVLQLLQQLILQLQLMLRLQPLQVLFIKPVDISYTPWVQQIQQYVWNVLQKWQVLTVFYSDCSTLRTLVKSDVGEPCLECNMQHHTTPSHTMTCYNNTRTLGFMYRSWKPWKEVEI